MTETKSEVTEVIEKILANGKSLYFIAQHLGKQHNQVRRMLENGRCQPWEFRELESMLVEVSRETIQNVSI